jgi:DNA-binding transcriptional ArsR family regulator
MEEPSDAPIDHVERSTLERLYGGDPDENIAELQEYRVDAETLADQETVFQALAHEGRLQLLEALRHGELCSCELLVVLDAPQSTVATHLGKLRDAGLVRSRKEGRWTYYRIADTAVVDLLGLAASIEVE